MVVLTKNEAWEKVNRIFPTDYDLDVASSEAAGYPIYQSTAQGNSSWISDLGAALEVNIQEGRRIRTVRINISPNEVPHIVEHVQWNASDIRALCMEHHWYTAGDVAAYSRLLDFVDNNIPTVESIYQAARDIWIHTSDPDGTVEDMMFEIGNRAVYRLYRRDDKAEQ